MLGSGDKNCKKGPQIVTDQAELEMMMKDLEEYEQLRVVTHEEIRSVINKKIRHRHDLKKH